MCALAPDCAVGVKAIAAGDYHSLALRSDGSVLAWGSNLHGQCDIPPAARGVSKIDAGPDWSAALMSNGSTVYWGAKGGKPSWSKQSQCNSRVRKSQNRARRKRPEREGWFFAHYERRRDTVAISQVDGRNCAVAFGLAVRSHREDGQLRCAGYLGAAGVTRLKEELAKLDVVFYWDRRDRGSLLEIVGKGGRRVYVRQEFAHFLALGTRGAHPLESARHLRCVNQAEMHEIEIDGLLPSSDGGSQLPSDELIAQIRSMMPTGPEQHSNTILDDRQLDSMLLHVASGIIDSDSALRTTAAACLRGRLANAAHGIARMCDLAGIQSTKRNGRRVPTADTDLQDASKNGGIEHAMAPPWRPW
jgi:hypothetical protein